MATKIKNFPVSGRAIHKRQWLNENQKTLLKNLSSALKRGPVPLEYLEKYDGRTFRHLIGEKIVVNNGYLALV